MLGVVMLACVVGGAEPPVVEVAADDTRISESCVVRIPPGLVIEDDEGDGVIQVVGDGVSIEFEAGSVLRGAAAGTPGDARSGVGVRVEGVEGVTLRGLRVHGYKVNVSAAGADGLVVDGADLSGAYQQRLRSTAWREDERDWLRPHENDGDEWVNNYGAALAIEESSYVTVRSVRVRGSQNGIVLDEVTDSDVYDNDCSFLSGWGLAMWRASRNTVSRNAFDFCVRGHEEGVYNRGQDSAGIVMFEQCNDNIVVENSCTHGGDGIFAFGGREAIGEVRPRAGAEIDYADAGCNDNVFLRNDLSFCSAHGFEMTFSENNVFARNRVEGNGICGVWGGYSSDSDYIENYFARNGALAYGGERGGINIEHGSGNRVLANTFENNRVGVRLWWDDDGRLLGLPGVGRGAVSGNVVAGNTFIMNGDHPFALGDGERLVGIQLQNFGGTGDDVGVNLVGANEWRIEGGVGERYDVGGDAALMHEQRRGGEFEIPRLRAIGETRPVSSRPGLRGRGAIVMGEWGPWDHEGVLVRRVRSGGGRGEHEVRGVADGTVLSVQGSIPDGLSVESTEVVEGKGIVAVAARESGVYEYSLDIMHDAGRAPIAGRIVGAEWEARVWAWEADPMKDGEAWREEARSVPALSLPGLDLAFGFGGPGRVVRELAPRVSAGDRFGMIARASIPLGAGAWRVRTVSDDGVRVRVDGQTLIERWDVHGPTPDVGEFNLDEAREVRFVVEYFENDGYATLRVDIEPAG